MWGGGPADDANVGQVLSCGCGVEDTPMCGSLPRVFTERSEVSLVTLNLWNEAVRSRGRGPGIHIQYYIFCEIPS